MVTLSEVISIYDDGYPRVDLFDVPMDERAAESLREGRLGASGYRALTGKEPPAELLREYFDVRLSLAKEARKAEWPPEMFLRFFGGELPEGVWPETDTAQVATREGQVGAQPR